MFSDCTWSYGCRWSAISLQWPEPGWSVCLWQLDRLSRNGCYWSQHRQWVAIWQSRLICSVSWRIARRLTMANLIWFKEWTHEYPFVVSDTLSPRLQARQHGHGVLAPLFSHLRAFRTCIDRFSLIWAESYWVITKRWPFDIMVLESYC